MKSSNAQLVRVGDLEIRPKEGLVLANGRAVRLSVREFDLLVALASHAGRIVSREELYRLAWGGTLRAGDRSCDVYIHKLRAKLERAVPDHDLIHTHVGFGYRLDPEPSHPFHKASTDRKQNGADGAATVGAAWELSEEDRS